MDTSAGQMIGNLMMVASQTLWERWLELVVDGQPKTSAPAHRKGAASANVRLVRCLAAKSNYRKVRRQAARSRTGNAHHDCVAFVAAALRQIGVPLARDQRCEGLVVSRVSLALSRYLESIHGWRRIEEPARLEPGDVMFSRDAPCCPGLPDHVYVFMGWHDRTGLIASVVDNEGFMHPCPLDPGDRHEHGRGRQGHAEIAGFGYALRDLGGATAARAARARAAFALRIPAV